MSQHDEDQAAPIQHAVEEDGTFLIIDLDAGQVDGMRPTGRRQFIYKRDSLEIRAMMRMEAIN